MSVVVSITNTIPFKFSSIKNSKETIIQGSLSLLSMIILFLLCLPYLNSLSSHSLHNWRNETYSYLFQFQTHLLKISPAIT